MTENEGDQKGIYTKDTIDTISFGDIEQAKNSFLINLNTMEIEEAVTQLKNLFVLMDTIITMYAGYEKVTSEKIKLRDKEYNFYDIERFLDLPNMTYDKIRKICELNFKIYNILRKPFISMPTARTNSKKKLLERLYSFIVKDEDWYNEFIANYTDYIKPLKFKDNFFNFRCYSIAEMYKYDLDCTISKVGYGRIGKSIFTLWELIRIVAFRKNLSLKEAQNWLISQNIVPEHVIYSDLENFDRKVGSIPNSYYIFDDAIFIADKREAMYSSLIKITKKISTFGKLNNIYWVNIQNLSDLDSRFTNKSNIIDVVTQRGLAYTYCSFKNVSIIKDFFGFEIFQKKPFLLRGTELQIEHNLKRIHSYIHKTKWRDMSKDPLSSKYNKLYDIYYANKDLWLNENNVQAIDISNDGLDHTLVPSDPEEAFKQFGIR